MKFPFHRLLPRREAFTLLELLVATALVAILGLLITQITISSQHLVRLNSMRMDADGQAGLVIDRLEMDLQMQLRRRDTDFIADNLGPLGNARFRLITSVPAAGNAAGGNRGLSLVAVEMATLPQSEGRPALVRAARPLGWEHRGILGLDADALPVGLADPAFPVQITETDFDLLAEGVIRMVVGFRLVPDGQPLTLRDGTLLPEAQGQLVYSPPVRLRPDGTPSTFLESGRIAGLVIGLVALDVGNLEQLNASQAQALASAFPTPTQDQHPAQLWAAKAESAASDSGLNSIPLRTRQALRVYERAIPLNPW